MKLPWTALSRPARLGLLTHLLHWLAVQMGQLYVGVFLFRVSHGYHLPALHAFCSYLAIPIGYRMGAGLCRRRGAAASLRTGLSIYAVYQGVILWLGAGAADCAGYLGAFWGLGVGFYWQGWVLLMVDFSEEGRDRDALLSGNQAAFFAASLLAAPLAGWFLSSFSGTNGYPIAFGASLAFFSAAWAVSLALKGRPHPGMGSLKRLLQARKPSGWNEGLFSALLLGFMSVGSMFLPMLISYESGGGEGASGSYTAWTALAGLGASALMARFMLPKRRAETLLWSALAIAALILPLAFQRSFEMVLLYGLGMAVALSVSNVPLFAAHIRILESSPRFLYRRADAMLLREVPLNLGRALACGLVLWGVQDLHSSRLTLLLALLAFTPLVNFAVLRPWLGER